MALVSPGVQVSVIDESFYTPAAPGTVPMIFVATAQNKANGSGTGTAAGTLAANAGKPYLLTSQRELVDTFGDPVFYTDANNNPIHGGELNEYGLQAAYSLLGVSNRVYVTRADIDLGVLQPSSEEPGANPDGGTNWLDTRTSRWGIFEWNSSKKTDPSGQTFTVQEPIVITDSAKIDGFGKPKESVGSIGQYAVRATEKQVVMFYKNTNNKWVIIGSPEWKETVPSLTSGAVGSDIGTNAGGTFDIVIGGNTVTINEQAGLSAYVTEINTKAMPYGITAVGKNSRLLIFNSGTTDDQFTINNVTGAIISDSKLNISEGVFRSPSLHVAPHTSVPQFKTAQENRPTGSVWIKTTEPNLGARWRLKRWNENVELFNEILAPQFSSSASALYSLDRSGGGLNLAQGDVYVRYNSEAKASQHAEFRIFARAAVGPTIVTSAPVGTQLSGTYSFTMAETTIGSDTLSGTKTVNVSNTGGNPADAEKIAAGINAVGMENVEASVDSQDRVVIVHKQGGDIVFTDTSGLLANIGFTPFIPGNPATTLNLYVPHGSNPGDFIASNWREADYLSQEDAPQNLANDGELWYSSIVDEVDIMVHDGATWRGYREIYPATNLTGPIVSASRPDTQTDGVSPLADNDLWIDTSDIDNYPMIYRYDDQAKKFRLVDSGDQTTDEGVLFADARWNASGANSGTPGKIADLLTSSFLDPDAPDPALYPQGMLLYNLRRSGFNVKRFVRDYISINEDNKRFGDESMEFYYPHRWVTESRNQDNGAGSFGRKAQRIVVVQSLQSLLNSNDAIRDDESRQFNIMATPAYPELIGEMITLNYDRGLSAFVVGDSPMRLTPDATSLNEWGQNVKRAVEDNDQGLVSYDEYMGVYYPAGFTSDNAGNNIVVPPSHMALRTIALSDQVSYPWFAPAGTRRGGVTNATASGYINDEGEFVSVALNEGQRDTLYSNAVNPITFLSGSGLVVFGQKTRARNASSLDRINVARLVVYLRGQLNRLAKPYLFEPNDKITRDEIKNAVESLLLELVGQRALYDYIVVCDESNNTPARIDRNELYVDVAIEPVKAIEFIYLPLRLKNTGEIAGL